MKNKIQKYILTGIMSIIPISLTYWIIKTLFIFFSKPGKSIISLVFKVNDINNQWVLYLQYLLGFILTIIFLYFLGLIISNVLGKKLYKYFESLLNQIPVVNKIYKSIKQITATLSMPNSKAFQKVVLIEYPRSGLWTICMVTGETKNDGELFYNIFVPTTPNPTSGYLLFINAKDTKELNLSVEEGLKIIISGGMVAPEDFLNK